MLSNTSNPQIGTSSTFFGWLTGTNRSANALATCVLTSDSWGVSNTVPSTGNVSHYGSFLTYRLLANTVSSVSGNLTFVSVPVVLDATSTLNVMGTSSFGKAVSVNGAVTIANTLTVTDNVSMSANVAVADVLVINTSGRTATVGTTGSSANFLVNGTATATGDISGFQSSDKRLKDSVNPIDGKVALEFVDSVKGGVTFTWKPDAQSLSSYVGVNKVGNDVGVIAQDIDQDKYPNMVIIRPDGYMAVDYGKMVPYLLAAIRELNHRVIELESDIDDVMLGHR